MAPKRRVDDAIGVVVATVESLNANALAGEPRDSWPALEPAPFARLLPEAAPSWRAERGSALRLIDLERRARFGRPCSYPY